MDQSRNRILGVSQYIENQWVVLIELPSDGPLTKKEVDEVVEQITNEIFENDKIFLTSPKGSVIFRRKTGPIRIDVK